MPHRLPRVSTALVILVLGTSLSSLLAQGGGGRGGPGAGQGPGQGGLPLGGQRAGGPPGGRGGQPRDGAGTTVGTGAISGTVILAGGGTPVRRAQVTLTGAELRGGRSLITDEEGRFNFQALPAGRFTLTASKPGYVENTYGAKRPGRPGTPIQLAEGQTLDRTVIALPKGGVITGVVVDEHGEATAGTTVRVLRFVLRTGERTLQQAGQAQTDDRGVYRIFQLQPGEYIVNALPRNMTAGDLRQSIAMELQSLTQQTQAMTGRAAGAGGQGGAIDVAGLAGLAAAGRGTQLLDRVQQLQQQLAQTDQQQTVAYAPVYYPGTTSAAGASTVTLGVSEERGGIDFQLQLVTTSRVSGLVAGPDGTLPQGTQVALVPADRSALPGLPQFGINQARVGGDGRFSFNEVTPGQYGLQARTTIRQPTAGAAGGGGGGFGGRGGPPGPQGAITQVLWAAADVSVGGQDVTNLVLNLQPGMTVGGRVEFQNGGTPVPADLTRVRVMLTPRGSQTFDIGSTPPGQTDATGHFTVAGVSPGRYTLSASIAPPTQAGAQNGGGPAGGGRVGGPPGTAGAGQWILKSAMVDGRDVLDFPLEVGPNQEISNAVLTFTDRSQELTGTIQDAAGRPTSDFTIILFPTDSRYWMPQSRRITSARPGTDGRFTLRGMPAGEYRLTAVTDVEPGEWYDPAFLGQVQQASIPITIAEGDKKAQDIRLAGGG